MGSLRTRAANLIGNTVITADDGPSDAFTQNFGTGADVGANVLIYNGMGGWTDNDGRLIQAFTLPWTPL